MRTKFILIVSFITVVYSGEITAQTPVPEDYFDLYDEEDPGESDFDQNTDRPVDPFVLPNDKELKNLYNGLKESGALGGIPLSSIESVIMVNEDCERTYICMYNTLKKVLTIALYELSLNKLELACKERKAILEDYLLFLQSMNLDIYCVEHLHPENNNLTKEELVNAMLAMADFYRFVSINYADTQTPNLPMLEPYKDVRKLVSPFCTGYIYEAKVFDSIYDPLEAFDCDCGTYEGDIKFSEWADVEEDLVRIINDINPIWQIKTALLIKNELSALPCNG